MDALGALGLVAGLFLFLFSEGEKRWDGLIVMAFALFVIIAF